MIRSYIFIEFAQAYSLRVLKRETTGLGKFEINQVCKSNASLAEDRPVVNKVVYLREENYQRSHSTL